MGIKDKVVAAFEFELVVVENFSEYVKGEIITEAEKIEALIGSEFEAHFVKKAVTPAEPASTN